MVKLKHEVGCGDKRPVNINESILEEAIHYTEFRVKSICIFYYFKIMCYILYIKRNLLYFYVCTYVPSDSAVKNLPTRQATQETRVWSLGQEDLLEDKMATHSSILAWRIPMDRGAWWAAVHGCHKELDVTEAIKLTAQHDTYTFSLRGLLKHVSTHHWLWSSTHICSISDYVC